MKTTYNLQYLMIPSNETPEHGDLILRHIWKGTKNECRSLWRFNEERDAGNTKIWSTLDGSFEDIKSAFTKQDLYVLSDDKIVAGDHFILTDDNSEKYVFVCYAAVNNSIWFERDGKRGYEAYSKRCRKIVATTNKKIQNSYIHQGSGKYHDDEPVEMKRNTAHSIVAKISSDEIVKFIEFDNAKNKSINSTKVMKTLTTQEDFKNLTPNTKIHEIRNGEIKHFIFVCINPKVANGMILLDSGHYGTAICKTIPTDEVLSDKKIVWVTDYDSVQIGKIMQEQLRQRIESIERIYVDKQYSVFKFQKLL